MGPCGPQTPVLSEASCGVDDSSTKLSAARLVIEEIILLVQKTYGIVGLLILAPFVAVGYLFKQNVDLHKDVVRATEKTAGAQEQRVNDAHAVNLKLLDVVKEQSSLNSETNTAMERLGDALNDIQNRLIGMRTP